MRFAPTWVNAATLPRFCCKHRPSTSAMASGKNTQNSAACLAWGKQFCNRLFHNGLWRSCINPQEFCNIVGAAALKPTQTIKACQICCMHTHGKQFEQEPKEIRILRKFNEVTLRKWPSKVFLFLRPHAVCTTNMLQIQGRLITCAQCATNKAGSYILLHRMEHFFNLVWRVANVCCQTGHQHMARASGETYYTSMHTPQLCPHSARSTGTRLHKNRKNATLPAFRALYAHEACRRSHGGRESFF